MEAAERQMRSLDNPGLCLDCGQENDECEPDTRNRRCQFCGRYSVFGAEELAMMIF